MNTRDHDTVKATTDADGKFRLPPQLEPHSLLVLHDSGYAEVSEATMAQSPEVRLVRWARVEGVLRIGSGPGAQKTLGMYIDRPRNDEVPQAYFDYDATSDADGRFTFARVLPGKARVYRAVRYAVRDSGFSSTGSHGIRVELQPGEMAFVQLGGTGRPIEGQAILPPGEQESIDWNFAIGRLSPKSAEVPYPENFREMDAEAQQAWYETRTKSDAYHEYLKAREQRITYAFTFRSDGSFRCDDVPAGDYKLSADVHDLPVPNR
jgi:hypothetical protein